MNVHRWVRRAMGQAWVASVCLLAACADAPEDAKSLEDQPLGATVAPHSGAPETRAVPRPEPPLAPASAPIDRHTEVPHRSERMSIKPRVAPATVAAPALNGAPPVGQAPATEMVDYNNVRPMRARERGPSHGDDVDALLGRVDRKVALAKAFDGMAAPATMAPELARRPDRMRAGADDFDAFIAPLDRRPVPHQGNPPPPASRDPHAGYGDRYSPIVDNGWQEVATAPLSTFSIDVDTASYANVRRFLQGGQLPPPDAVRIEEMLNYFSYDLPEPAGGHPLDVFAEVSETPWNPANRLLKVSLQGRHVAEEALPPAQLVFLIDVSGSMDSPDRLPLLQQGLERLVEQLRPQDRVAIVVYASQAGLVLPPTAGDQKAAILTALRGLRAEGSTAGGQGIQLAYETARQGFIPGGNNRVILATDGDFNVGVTNNAALVRLIEQERQSGVFLTILGVGRGNYQDARMERLAGAGNGQAAYLDTPLEAERVLVNQLAGTLHTLAQDVKLQLEFNPAKVKEYRLIGYENRILAASDFNNDRKDAGDLGAGHSVTALYELVPADALDPLRYGAWPPVVASPKVAASSELLFLKLRYQQPGGSKSTLITRPVEDTHTPLAQASVDLRFASAVAELGLLLRRSPHRGTANFAALIQRARGALGPDLEGHRIELVDLAQKARRLMGEETNAAIAR